MNSSAKSSFDMSRLCQPKCWKMLHIVILYHIIILFSSICLFMTKRCFATPQLDPEQLLRDALAGHSQCRAGPVFSLLRAAQSQWIPFESDMAGVAQVPKWPEHPWRCHGRKKHCTVGTGSDLSDSTPSPWRHESNPQPTHSKSWHLKTLFQLLRFNPFLRYGPLK